MKVHIPFYPRFETPLRNGQKTLTSRTRWFGMIGDTFEIFKMRFQIKQKFVATLETVSHLWYSEGCASRDDFIKVWEKIHYKYGFIPKQKVNVHRFKRVK